MVAKVALLESSPIILIHSPPLSFPGFKLPCRRECQVSDRRFDTPLSISNHRLPTILPSSRSLCWGLHVRSSTMSPTSLNAPSSRDRRLSPIEVVTQLDNLTVHDSPPPSLKARLPLQGDHMSSSSSTPSTSTLRDDAIGQARRRSPPVEMRDPQAALMRVSLGRLRISRHVLKLL